MTRLGQIDHRIGLATTAAALGIAAAGSAAASTAAASQAAALWRHMSARTTEAGTSSPGRGNAVSRTRIASTLIVVVVSLCLYTPIGADARTSSYVSGFRAAYLPVASALHRVTPACATVTRVEQLPACGAASVPFQAALARFLRFLTHTAPPAAAKADVRTLVAATRVLQQRFATQAALIKRKDLVRFKAMGGTGHAMDNAINAFGSAVGNVVLDVPALRVPLP